MSLSNEELEKLEKRYLDEIYFAMSDAQSSMVEYLTSKDKIRESWWKHFQRADKKKQTSDLSRGAERVFFYLSPQDWRPNSSPIASDLFFESHDAYIHIDVKTARKSNTADFGGEVPFGHNQSSYEPSKSYSGTTIETQAHLPRYYPDEGEKACLTYALQIIYDHKTFDIIGVLLVCMPNGQLFDVYGNDIIKAGKSKNESFRYKFSRNPYFELLQDKPFRVRILYYTADYRNELSKQKILGFSYQKMKEHPDFPDVGSELEKITSF